MTKRTQKMVRVEWSGRKLWRVLLAKCGLHYHDIDVDAVLIHNTRDCDSKVRRPAVFKAVLRYIVIQQNSPSMLPNRWSIIKLSAQTTQSQGIWNAPKRIPSGD